MDIVAHRGVHHVYPENSLAAFQAGWGLGIWGCECDVFALGDGSVVIHDEVLERTTEGCGRVVDQTVEQLKGCRLKDRRGGVTEHLVPRLEQLIEAMPAESNLLVELKGVASGAGVIEDFFREVRGGRRVLQSFDWRHLALARRYDCSIPLVWLVETGEALLAASECPWESIFARHDLLNGITVGKLRDAGKRIGAWTVNDAAEMQRMIELGIDVLITDEPESAVEILVNR